MGFIGEVRLGIIMIFWRGEGSRRAGAGLRFADEWAAEEILDQVGSRLAAGRGLPFAPAKGSKRVFKPNLRSPVGVAENMQGAKPVRLAAGAFLLCVQKEPKYAWGCAPRPRRVGTPRPESQSNGFPERD